MAEVTLGNDRTLVIAADTVTNVTLPFNIRHMEIEKHNQPDLYVKIGAAINKSALSETRLFKADINSFDLYNEPSGSIGVPPHEYPFIYVSFYCVAGATINFLNMTASASI